MSPERPASDHEMLCELWDEVRKLKVALDEVLYRTASREEHDQKVRAEVLREAADCPLTIEPTYESERGTAAHLRDQLRSLAGAVEKK